MLVLMFCAILIEGAIAGAKAAAIAGVVTAVPTVCVFNFIIILFVIIKN